MAADIPLARARRPEPWAGAVPVPTRSSSVATRAADAAADGAAACGAAHHQASAEDAAGQQDMHDLDTGLLQLDALPILAMPGMPVLYYYALEPRGREARDEAVAEDEAARQQTAIDDATPTSTATTTPQTTPPGRCEDGRGAARVRAIELAEIDDDQAMRVEGVLIETPVVLSFIGVDGAVRYERHALQTNRMNEIGFGCGAFFSDEMTTNGSLAWRAAGKAKTAVVFVFRLRWPSDEGLQRAAAARRAQRWRQQHLQDLQHLQHLQHYQNQRLFAYEASRPNEASRRQAVALEPADTWRSGPDDEAAALVADEGYHADANDVLQQAIEALLDEEGEDAKHPNVIMRVTVPKATQSRHADSEASTHRALRVAAAAAAASSAAPARNHAQAGTDADSTDASDDDAAAEPGAIKAGPHAAAAAAAATASASEEAEAEVAAKAVTDRTQAAADVAHACTFGALVMPARGRSSSLARTLAIGCDGIGCRVPTRLLSTWIELDAARTTAKHSVTFGKVIKHLVSKKKGGVDCLEYADFKIHYANFEGPKNEKTSWELYPGQRITHSEFVASLLTMMDFPAPLELAEPKTRDFARHIRKHLFVVIEVFMGAVPMKMRDAIRLLHNVDGSMCYARYERQRREKDSDSCARPSGALGVARPPLQRLQPAAPASALAAASAASPFLDDPMSSRP